RSIRLQLVEVSAAARSAQTATLGEDAGRLVWSDSTLPSAFEGVLIANELLDALPVHQVVMREDGLREVYVIARSAEASHSQSGDLALVEGPPSSRALAAYLERLK